MDKFHCKQCTNCCKTYWITLLPSEAKKQSKFLKLSLANYLKKNCVVLIQLFPSTAINQPGLIDKNDLPKEIQFKLPSHAQSFHVLPSIALKRVNDKTCIFLKNNVCLIYKSRPKQCQLFPLISLTKDSVNKNDYAFCVGLQHHAGQAFIDKGKNQSHYKQVKAYFDSVKKKGFRKVWPATPNTTVVLFKDELIWKGKSFVSFIK